MATPRRFCQVLIRQARELYAQDRFSLDLSNTVYALDSTTIDLCLSMFPWALFRSTKAAVKMHTLLDLRGAIPSFIHISNGKLQDVNILDLLAPEAGAFYVMDRGYLDFERLYALHQARAFFVTRAKSNLDARRLYSASVDRTTGILCDQTIAFNGYRSHRYYPAHLRRIRFKDAGSIPSPNRSVRHFFMLLERLFRRFQNPHDTQTSLPIVEGFRAVLDTIQEISGFELKRFQLFDFRRPHIAASITDQKLVNTLLCLYISALIIHPSLFQPDPDHSIPASSSDPQRASCAP